MIFNSIFLLQAIAPTGNDDRSVIIWVAVAAVAALGIVGGALIKVLQDHPKHITQMNANHAEALKEKSLRHEEAIKVLNDEIRKIQAESAHSFLEYSQMLHNAVAQVSQVHPEMKELFRELEKSLSSELDKYFDKIDNLLTKIN